MKKFLAILLVLLMACTLFAACDQTCEHSGGTATCTEAAICEKCGEAYGEALGHSHSTEWSKDEANHWHQCTCGDKIDVTAHNWVAGDITTNAGCTTTGKQTYTCACGATKQEDVSALGHSYTEVVTAPTCTESGYTTHTCSVCGDSYTDTEVPATGHSYDDVVTAPTCTEAGYTTHTCSVCNHSYTDTEVPANGHSYDDVVTDPTCTEAGYTTHTCSVCGDSYTDTEVPANGHKFVDSKCTVCSASYKVETTWTLTTQLKNGDKVLIGAPSYGKLLSAEKVSADSFYNKGVDYSAEDFSNVTDAEIFVVTVNDDGTYTFTSLTGKVIALASNYSSLNADGEHKSWALTDREDGTFLMKNTGRNTYLEWYSSKNNWSTYSAGNTAEYYLSFYAETTAGDHVHNHISATTQPTCTEDGYVTYTCDCGNTYTVDGETATGHTEADDVAVDPTCTKTGLTAGKHCSVCNTVIVAQKEVASLGHTFEEGKCTVCGITGEAADFDTIESTGTGQYTKPFTTAAGWQTVGCAIQVGGPNVANPAYPVVGPNNTYKAVCLSGSTTSTGKLTSPTLNGGISELTIRYTKIFTDTQLSVTVTITDVATGEKYTHVISATLESSEKYVIYTDVWTLDVTISGQFTIEVVNNCPSQNTGNKDRFTILDLYWHAHDYKETDTSPATCTEPGTITYTCNCGHSYTENTDTLGHIDENLDIDCDREGCTSKVAPKADTVLSCFTANNLGSKLSTSSQYYVVGTIVEVLDAKNGIFLVDDGTGEKFYFRLPKDADGVSHANWTIKLVLGDKVQIYGKINKYTTNTAPNGQYWPAMQSPVVTLLEQHPHDFTFAPATCGKPAYCACGQSSGEALGCADTDGDQLCDDCGKNVNYIYEYVEIRTDNNSGVLDATAGTYTWGNANFDVQVTKGTSTQLYTTAKDHMRLYKNNQIVLSNKNGLTVKTITVYLTNATQVGYFEKFLTGYTYTTDTENFTVTVEINSTENITFTNPSNGSTTQIKGFEFGYEKPQA